MEKMSLKIPTSGSKHVATQFKDVLLNSCVDGNHVLIGTTTILFTELASAHRIA
jgi:hypothetical protein